MIKEVTNETESLNFLFLSFIILFSAILIVGCGMDEVESTWRDRAVTIDGIDNGIEWENSIYYFGEQKVAIGILNDESDLYIRLSSRDRNMQRQIIALGFTVWLDAKGGKKKTLGIHFPIGMQSSGIQVMRGVGRIERNEDTDQLQKMLEESQKEIEVFGPGKKESCTLFVADAKELGINSKINFSKGNLVYELQIPLVRSESKPFGIGSEMSQTIGIGLETGKINVEQMRNQMGGRGGGMGGIGGRGGGGSGGMRGGRGRTGRRGGRQMTESIELWLKTELASDPIAP